MDHEFSILVVPPWSVLCDKNKRFAKLPRCCVLGLESNKDPVSDRVCM